MAVVSMFYGIIISMFYFDNRRHHLPHIHVKYQEDEAIFTIQDGIIIEGDLPINKKKLVDAWMEIHRDDLLADWQLASSGQNIYSIEPLR